MRRSTPLAAPLAAAIFVLAAVALARAETWSLELKRLGAENRYPCYPQRFYAQIGDKGKSHRWFPRVEEQAAAFKRIVKKEPKYESKYPLRCVAKLGSREYAFAIDAVLPQPRVKVIKSGAKATQPPAKPDSATAKLVEKLLEVFSPSALEPTYNRLYFDFNHNGDLTDDEIVEADRSTSFKFKFPRIDVTIDADRAKFDSSFFLSGHLITRANKGYARVSLRAAACREGDITLNGKKRHVVLIDFNSNGRFDDQTTFPADHQAPGEPLSPQTGDVLLVDPDPRKLSLVQPYNPTTDNHVLVSKLVELDGRFYDMQVLPAGDQLTLTPSSPRLGNIANPHDGFHAIIYNDKGFIKIGGNKGLPIPVPEGQWKLLSYVIDQTEKAALLALVNSLRATLGGDKPQSKPRRTFVWAWATTDCKPVMVRAGETATMPFGPPYTPVVTADTLSPDKKELSLAMSLIGSAGERCAGITVNGRQPPQPEFTITDPEGKVVQQGNFEYG